MSESFGEAFAMECEALKRVRGAMGLSNVEIMVPFVRTLGEAQSVIDDDGEAELVRRRPDARVEHVVGAGHSVQGDRPVELAALIADFVATS